MVQPFQLRCRTRRRLIWLVTLLLLWQQVALAAYVCPQPAPAAAVATASMAMTRADCMSRMPMSHHDLACAEHCAAAPSAQPDARAPNVPASLLSVLPPLAATVDRLSGSAVPVVPCGRLIADSPPPRLRFCSLLI